MDKRETFKDLQQLRQLLEDIYRQQKNASFLIDRQGLTRMEGMVLAIEKQETIYDTSVLLNNNERILLSEIVAVNGIFQSDYSEC